MAYESESHFKINFALIQHHKYSLTEIENMIPWERSLSYTYSNNTLKKKTKGTTAEWNLT